MSERQTIRLVAADEDAAGIGQRRVVEVLRQGDEELARDSAVRRAGLVDEAALQHAQEVEERYVLHAVVVDGLYVVAGDVPRGEHAEERAVLVDDRHRAQLVFADRPPGEIHRDGAAERGRAVEIQVAHLRAHGLDHRGRLKAEAVEQLLRLVVDGADARGLVFAVAHRVAEVRVRDRGDDRIGIGVPVPGHIYVAHAVRSFSRLSYEIL